MTEKQKGTRTEIELFRVVFQEPKKKWKKSIDKAVRISQMVIGGVVQTRRAGGSSDVSYT
jgi:hypothetical protein